LYVPGNSGLALIFQMDLATRLASIGLAIRTLATRELATRNLATHKPIQERPSQLSPPLGRANSIGPLPVKNKKLYNKTPKL
jgi:hypothetical protein